MRFISAALAAALLIVVAVSDFIPRLRAKAFGYGVVAATPYFFDQTRPSVLLAQRNLERFVPKGTPVVIGDSIAARWSSPYPNFGIGGQRSDQLLADLPQSVHSASAVIVAIGTNDLFQGRSVGIERRIAALNAKIAAPIYLLAVPPVEGSEAFNKRLASACDEGCTFIDPHLTPADLIDGIHPREYSKIDHALAPLQRENEGSKLGASH
jgi:hypothetical protein